MPAVQPLPPQHYFVAARDMMLRSTLGYVLTIKKGEPTHIPKVLHTLALEKGLTPCDKDGRPLELEEAQKVVPPEPVRLKAPEDAEERKAAILAVIKDMVARNSSADFGGGGLPKTDAVRLALGWHVDSKEIAQIWNANRRVLLTGKTKDD